MRCRSGSCWIAWCTRHCVHVLSARASGPGSCEGRSGGSATDGSPTLRPQSTIALRATVYSQAEPTPRSGR